MFRVTKRQLWDSSASLSRLGELRFTGKSLAWKTCRIHKSALKHIEKIVEDHNAMVEIFGVEVERADVAGNKFKRFEVLVGTDSAKEYKTAFENLMDETVEVWGDPILLTELPDEFWGKPEEKDGNGKVTSPALPPMLSNFDLGTLSEWLILGE